MTQAITDQAAFDEQFSLDRILDLDVLLARRAHAGAVARDQFEMTSHVPYAPGAGHTLNIFPAHGMTAPALAPVQIFIHGGFWRSLDADLFSFIASGFVPFGAMLVVIDYPLMPQARLADVVGACRAAIGWVHAHIANYGGDPDALFISGNSAGGHLVAELLDRSWLADHHLPRDVIKGGTAISGLYELDPVRRSFQNDSLQLTTDEVASFSPARRTLDLGAPVIATVGGDETEEFQLQTARFADQCRKAGVPVEHLVVADADHVTIVLDTMSDPATALNRAMRRQMGLSL